MNLLSERLGFKVMPEEFRDQHDLLSRFHHDRKWAFPMQLNFLVTRFAQYLCASEEEEVLADLLLRILEIFLKVLEVFLVEEVIVKDQECIRELI